MSTVVNKVNTITVDLNTGLPILAAGIAAGAASKQSGESKIKNIMAGIAAAATAAEAVPNPEVEAFAGLAALIASIIHAL